MSETIVGGYLRHRDRMIQQSIMDDLEDTLIAARWMAGTTKHEVVDPYDTSGDLEIVTTPDAKIMPMLKGDEINLIDYFPESREESRKAGVPAAGKTPLNTLAVDVGNPGDAIPRELGSNAIEQPYLFNIAFYANSDASALALMSDLKDRYAGRLVRDDSIELWDYNSQPMVVVARMDVESFRYSRDVEQVSPNEVHMFFAELVITDYVD